MYLVSFALEVRKVHGTSPSNQIGHSFERILDFTAAGSYLKSSRRVKMAKPLNESSATATTTCRKLTSKAQSSLARLWRPQRIQPHPHIIGQAFRHSKMTTVWSALGYFICKFLHFAALWSGWSAPSTRFSVSEGWQSWRMRLWENTRWTRAKSSSATLQPVFKNSRNIKEKRRHKSYPTSERSIAM